MTRKAVSLLTRSTLLAAAAPFALAQPAAAQTTRLDEIVLSASRLPQEAGRTGVSVTVVTAEDLEKAGDRQLSSYLARLPGVSVTQNGPIGATTQVRLRGVETKHVAVYIDGIRVDDPASASRDFNFGALMTGDIGRVEILRGSQSAVWGGSAIGGVINITTQAALRDGFSQGVAVEGGSHGTIGGTYRLGYRDDRMETSLSLTHLRTKGFSAIDTLPRDPSLEPDGFEATRLAFSTRYRVSEALSFGGAAFVQQSRNDYDSGNGNSLHFGKRREYGARLFAEYEAGRSSHVFDVTTYRVDREDWNGAALTSRFKGQRLKFAYQGTTEFSPAFTAIYGADTEVEKAGVPNSDKTRVSGVFAQGLWRPSDALDLSLSLRNDHNSDFGNQPSARAALAWQATPELTLRASAATGFLSPPLYQRYGDLAWNIVPNPALAPEKSKSLEIGADYRLNGGASFGVTLFAIDTDNAIGYLGCPWDPATQSCAPGTFNIYDNVPGKTKRRGLEFSADVPLGDRFGLRAAYTYLDATDPAGARVVRVPRHNLNLTLEAKITDRLDGWATVQHVAGRVGSPWDGPMFDYTVVNAGLTYGLAENTSLSLRVENLFDRDYQVLPGYGTSGRAFHVGLRRSF